jgi:hypothetical protein
MVQGISLERTVNAYHIKRKEGLPSEVSATISDEMLNLY